MLDIMFHKKGQLLWEIVFGFFMVKIMNHKTNKQKSIKKILIIVIVGFDILSIFYLSKMTIENK